MESKPRSSEFARTQLPWIAGGIMFLIYLATLNQWVSVRSLSTVAKITGWDWTLPTQWPLFYVLTYPFRFLSASWQPLALNIFAAVCASLSIALLVRSVAILPHDRTDEQRIRQRTANGLLTSPFVWPPALLAAFVLGLQLTMWEHATAVTNESLDLLIFAYLVRCLLEYRISQNERWLSKLAFVYGLGVTNTWALIGFFPFFLGALIWIRGKSFLNLQFIFRMLALGLVGMLLYLVIPIAWHFKSEGQATFWEALRGMLAGQKSVIFDAPTLRARALLLSLTSVVPVIIMGVKFPTGFGDVSSAGSTITDVMFRGIHMLFAGACIWVAFDQQYSPRALVPGHTFLTFYYLGALAAGYYLGYLRLVHTEAPKKSYRPLSAFSKLLNPVVQGVVWGAVVLVPLALAYKNLKIVRSQNGKLLREFAQTIDSHISNRPALVLSEDFFQLWLMDAWYTRSPADRPVLVNTRALPYPTYHREMVRRYGARWPKGGAAEDAKTRIEQLSIVATLNSLTVSNSIYYLHPSFGNLFETVYAQPRGLVMELKRYSTNMIYAPLLTAGQAQTNRALWKDAENLVLRTEALEPFKIQDAMFVGFSLARALNTWGVHLQRMDNFTEAQGVFETALNINSNNLPAELNLAFNMNRATGKLPTPRTGEDFFGVFRGWEAFLTENGPIDVPEYLFPLGQGFQSQGLYRQAVDSYARAAQLNPTNTGPRMALAAALIASKWTDEAVKVIAQLQTDTNLNRAEKLELISMDAGIQFARQDTNRAEAILQKALETYPNELVFYENLDEMYRASGQWDKALGLASRQLERSPTNVLLRLKRIETAINIGNTNVAQDDLKILETQAPGNLDAAMFRVFMAIQTRDFKKGMAEVENVLQFNEKNSQALVYKGIMHMELKEEEKAIETLNAALKADPNNLSALRNRAIANLHAERLNDAKKDYGILMGAIPRSHTVYYGLGEIAYKKKEKEEALKNYKLYLKYVPRQGPVELGEEIKRIEERVKELEAK